MATNPELFGKELKHGPTAITADAILKFGIGINDHNPSSSDAKAASFRAHPMFAATSIIPGTGMIVFQPGIGVSVNKIVHGGIEIDFGAAIKPGDALQNVAALLGIDDKGTGKLVNIRFTTSNQKGEMVARGVTRYFSRGKPKDGEPAKDEKKDGAAFAATDSIAVPTLPKQSILYAEGSGDRFPIHTDDNFAKSVGLPGMIMHGMCTLALSANALIDKYAGGNLAALKRLSCKFSHIVLPGGVLTVEVRQNDKAVEFQTRDDKGNIAISEGVAVFG